MLSLNEMDGRVVMAIQVGFAATNTSKCPFVCCQRFCTLGKCLLVRFESASFL